jgi:hypothetical protein
MADFTDDLIDWLEEQFDPTDISRVAGGILIGIALSIRHPKTAERSHKALLDSMKIRGAGSLIEYEGMSIASGDERTSNEKLADELAEHLERSLA